MSHFQIHRIDDPRVADRHHRAFRRIGGQTFRVHARGLVEGQRPASEHRPRDARHLEGPAWMRPRPIRQAEAVRAECRDQRSAYLSPSPVSSQ
jgi:hypothetical protein